MNGNLSVRQTLALLAAALVLLPGLIALFFIVVPYLLGSSSG